MADKDMKVNIIPSRKLTEKEQFIVDIKNLIENVQSNFGKGFISLEVSDDGMKVSFEILEGVIDSSMSGLLSNSGIVLDWVFEHDKDLLVVDINTGG